MVPVCTAAPSLLNVFEKEREERIAENLRKIKDLGVTAAVEQLAALASPREKKERKPRSSRCSSDLDEVSEVRRSSRDVKRIVSYKEEDTLKDLPGMRGSRGPRLSREVDDAEVQALRDRNGVCMEEAEAGCSQGGSAGKRRGPVDSGKGVRVQGGKIYDSKFGVTCHWCRQKTLTENVTCSNAGCGKGKRLPYTFCKSCLFNRHGEDSNAAAASGAWVCPCCRGSCGSGCISCCNCGPCRKKAGLEPTGHIKGSAVAAGFDNVHDYLVHLVTGEDQEEVATRKARHAWGAWLTAGPAAEEGRGKGPADGSAAAEQKECEDEDASVMGSTCDGAAQGQRKRGRAEAQPRARGECASQRQPGGSAGDAAAGVAAAGGDGQAEGGDAPRAAGVAPAAKKGRGRPPLPKKLPGSCVASEPVVPGGAWGGQEAAAAEGGAGVGGEPEAVAAAPGEQLQQQEEAAEEEEEAGEQLTRKQRALKKLGLRARS